MQLTAFVDLTEQAGDASADIPCLQYDAALWFAESPADVELAKSLCGRSRGASGVASSSSRGRSSPANVRVDVPASTRWPPDVDSSEVAAVRPGALLHHASHHLLAPFRAMIPKPYVCQEFHDVLTNARHAGPSEGG